MGDDVLGPELWLLRRHRHRLRHGTRHPRLVDLPREALGALMLRAAPHSRHRGHAPYQHIDQWNNGNPNETNANTVLAPLAGMECP